MRENEWQEVRNWIETTFTIKYYHFSSYSQNEASINQQHKLATHGRIQKNSKS